MGATQAAISQSGRRLNCFDSISVVTRDGNPIDLDGKNPEAVLKNIINIDKWNNSKKQYERE